MEEFSYRYKAFVEAVYDGDSITVCIDLGLNIKAHNQKIRLFGIDTPELRGEERERGLMVRDWLREQILHKEIYLETIKDKTGKYGRWLGIVVLPGEETSINNQLLKLGYAKVYE